MKKTCRTNKRGGVYETEYKNELIIDSTKSYVYVNNDKFKTYSSKERGIYGKKFDRRKK